jgi:hypothetical protein
MMDGWKEYIEVYSTVNGVDVMEGREIYTKLDGWFE